MHIEGNTVCSYKNCSEWQRDNSMELHELSIAATHSPIIVSSCKKANIINVEAEQTVNYVKSSYAFSVNGDSGKG